MADTTSFDRLEARKRRPCGTGENFVVISVKVTRRFPTIRDRTVTLIDTAIGGSPLSSLPWFTGKRSTFGRVRTRGTRRVLAIITVFDVASVGGGHREIPTPYSCLRFSFFLTSKSGKTGFLCVNSRMPSGCSTFFKGDTLQTLLFTLQTCQQRWRNDRNLPHPAHN